VPCALLLRSTFCLDLPRSAHGRRGWAEPLPSREGVGVGWSVFSSRSRSSEPVSRPTASLSPNQSPSNETGAQLGGLRWDDVAHELPHPSSGCADEDAAPVVSLEPAPLRPTCHKAKRLARRTSRLEYLTAPAREALLYSYDGVHARQDKNPNEQRALARAHCQHWAQPAAGPGPLQPRSGASRILSERVEIVPRESGERALQAVQGRLARSCRKSPSTHRTAALT